jgi:hypothetical protein
MTARGQKLLGAGEIHKFNRDVADALARIQEKLNEIPDAVGKDVGASEALLRAHEQFENDLVPLEAQMQVKLSATVEDFIRLCCVDRKLFTKTPLATQENFKISLTTQKKRNLRIINECYFMKRKILFFNSP